MENHRFGLFVLLFVFLVVLAFCSLLTGDVPLLELLQSSNFSDSAWIILWQLRLPRTLLAIEVGAALALSGAALQNLVHNPLADPALTGASQGAALFAALVFYYGFLSQLGIFALPLAAFIGAGFSLLLLFFWAGFLSSNQRFAPESFILAGLALSTLSGALLGAVLNFAPNPFAMQELVFWLMGSLSERTTQALYFLTPALIIGAWGIFSARHFLSALSLGSHGAQSLGFSVGKMSMLVVFYSALLVSASVATAGSIGFVGLIVPHMARKMFGENPSQMLLPSLLLGALLVLLADILVRLLPGEELKLGILTSLIGAPFFVFLLCQTHKNRF